MYIKGNPESWHSCGCQLTRTTIIKNSRSQSDQASVGYSETSDVHGGLTLQTHRTQRFCRQHRVMRHNSTSAEVLVHASTDQSCIILMVCPPWIRLLPACPTNARLDWDLGYLEDRVMPQVICHIPWAISRAVLWCVRTPFCPFNFLSTRY